MGLRLFGPPGLNGPPNEVDKLMTSPPRYRRGFSQSISSFAFSPSQILQIRSQTSHKSPQNLFFCRPIDWTLRQESIECLGEDFDGELAPNLELKSVERGRSWKKVLEGEAWIRSRRFWGCARVYRGFYFGFWRRRSWRRWNTSTSPSPSPSPPSPAPSSSCTPISSNRSAFQLLFISMFCFFVRRIFWELELGLWCMS